MRIAIIGRTEILYETTLALRQAGHEITCILTAKEAPEYSKIAQDFYALATQWQIPYACSAKIAEYYDFLLNSESDIAVSINYSGVIPSLVTDLFPLGILNVHGGDLPRYRGNACQAWAIINGEDKIGLCVHRMVGGELDSGDIIARTYLDINQHTKIGQVMDWITAKTPPLVHEAITMLAHDSAYILEKQSQDSAHILRCYPRKPEDARIDWGSSAMDIVRLINASGKPYAGAFCYFEGNKITVWEAQLAPAENFLGIPGQIAAVAESHIDVLTGDGKLRILHLEKDGEVLACQQLVSSTRKRFE